MYLDTARWPIVVNTQIAQVTDAQVERYLTDLERLQEREEPFVLVLDVLAAVPMNSKQRKRLSDWMRAHPREMARLLGIAFVESSTLMRGAMQAIFWLNPPVYPYTIVRQSPDALRWAEERSREHLARRAG